MRDEILQIPEHLLDATWKVESARINPFVASAMAVCGMGGSAIGADLAAGVLGDRLEGPLVTVRGYALPSWLNAGPAVLISSYSGDTEETVACYEEALERDLCRTVATTGGRIGEMAREAGDPVIGLPGIISQPRSAVAYMLVSSLSVAASMRIAPRLDTEIEEAARWLQGCTDALQAAARKLATEIADRTPVVFGAGPMAPVARRWKGQLNENSKRHAFYSEIPESCHNEAVAWGTSNASAGFHAVLLSDPAQHQRERLRIELLRSMIEDSGGSAQVIEAEGDSATARLVWAVMLGDLVSIELAEADGVDPQPVPPIDRLKQQLG